MAKSSRATTVKRNRAKLRSSIFGPADHARTERLSTKLQELAAQPKPARDEATNTGDDEKDNSPNTSPTEEPSTSAMDIDDAQSEGTKQSRKSRRHSIGRIEKKKLRRKARSSIVFPSKPTKQRRAVNPKKRK